MGAEIAALSGTPAGELLALAFALISALAHATFGAINKSGADPYLNRGAINVCYSLIALPFALFVLPWPTRDVWIVLGISYVVHIAYEWLQATSYRFGAFSVVYPIVRGTGPLVTAAVAVFVFGEFLALGQWFGMVLLSGAIFGFAVLNLREQVADMSQIRGLRLALAAAFTCGLTVAAYTIIDAYGIRLAADPFTFLAWFFTLGGVGFPFIALARWHQMPVTARPALRDLAARGVLGAIFAYLSFGGALLAMRLDKVGEAAALRETSIIFATAIGVLVFREKITIPRLVLIALIVIGAMMVEFG